MVRDGEGKLLDGGTFAVRSGERTGRSPKDKFMIKAPNISEHVWWGQHNQPLDEETFDRIVAKVEAHLAGRDLYIQDCYVSQDPDHRRTVRVVAEQAYHSLFARTMFVPREKLADEEDPGLTILHAPSLELDGVDDGINSGACVLLHMGQRVIVIAGTAYAGEMKKSVFTAMNYYLPLEGVLSLHSAANVDPRTGKTALFFGLSGTGKTTLSADPKRHLIGDDEHGWSDDGVFNFEGGCYAKTIDLTAEGEPEIYEAIRFGSILENVGFDRETGEVDYTDVSITQNTRCSYPIEHIDNAKIPCVGGHPKNIIFLTCDAFGVLPPVSRLTPAQAMYQFISGYTAKVAGTEMGVTEPEPNFSACYGAAFLSLHPTVYAELLAEKIKKHFAEVWLVNTGWTGGSYGVGHRFALSHTRAIIDAIHGGQLSDARFEHDDIFGLAMPDTVPGVPSEVLNPRSSWKDKEAYDATARKLAGMFVKNFEKFADQASDEILSAAPKAG